MSRFLKKCIKNLRLFLYAGVFLAAAGVALSIAYANLYFLLISGLGIVLIAAALINKQAVAKLKNQYAVFSPQSSTRNVDCLLVGDMVLADRFTESGTSVVQLAAPGRGFFSDYELIRHAHSILKDGGSIIVAYYAKNADKGLSIFDYPIFHQITFEKYHCTDKKKRMQFPLLFAPVRTLRFLYGPSAKDGTLKYREFPAIDSFCEERGYNVTYIEL